MLMKALIKDKRLYEAPKGTEPPPFWIRGMLVLTCTGVSFFHGSNDGQKGMGLIMLILIGTVPTTYALNHAVTASQSADFVAVSHQTADMLGQLHPATGGRRRPARRRHGIHSHQGIQAQHHARASRDGERYRDGNVSVQGPVGCASQQVRNFRNDMYLVSEAIRLMQKVQETGIFNRG